MPSRVPEKITFLAGEIAGVQARIGNDGNAVQRHKLEMLSEICEDYRASAQRAADNRSDAA